ncbi:hypothetical protein HanOQP8_Chr11g0416481 [Helianthus annuus]|nr:hypothetical protein HanHA89_Chr11g0437761 [Helianthus annuus]KAJ0686499.1 hypothetical protein HanLR1_Chr11g0415461 [Helianthus annuus]KAJ0690315.1 hypothetical protein HanOQP8_Chr11g0416481 [Helianthus annuus]
MQNRIANATTHNLESSSTPLSVFVELYAKQLIVKMLKNQVRMD